MNVVSGTAATMPRLPARVRTISVAISSLFQISAVGLVVDQQDDEQRQRGADIGEEQRVDGRADVRPPDAERAVEQLPALEPAAFRQLINDDGLGHRDVVEHAQRAEDDRGEQDPAQVEAAAALGRTT